MSEFKIQSISDAGDKRKPNEDGVILLGDLFVVLDGATGLGSKKIPFARSDAEWFVQQICSYFKDNWTHRKQFVPTLKKALLKVNVNFKEITSSTSPLKPFELPSAGLVAIQVFKTHLETYRIGDCSLLIKLGNEISDVFGETPLQALDEKSISKLSSALRRGMSYQDARKSIEDILKKNRSQMNQKNGYSVLTTNPESINGLESFQILKDNGMQLLLSTDGFSAIFERYEYSTYDVFEELKSISPQELIRKIRRIEQNDKNLLRYPRLKPHDDATYVYMEI